MDTLDLSYTTELGAPFALIPVEPVDLGIRCPEEWRERVMVDVSHDGACIPEEFLVDERGRPHDGTLVRHHYEQERDWGASLVAARVAACLGLDGFHRIEIARVLLDFGRFPGITRRDFGHLRRLAINHPFSKLLTWRQSQRVLEAYYDAIAGAMDEVVRHRLIKVAIHTYDRYNASGTERPPLSLVTRALTYQTESELPFGAFDEMTPHRLGETTTHTLLRDRLALTLEKAGFPCEHNYPYLLPEGGVEVRSQVWFFFNYLRRRFEQAHPETTEDRSFWWVWTMLTDTNLRSSESEALRSYLHMYRQVPASREDEFRAARLAYQRVREFLEADHKRIVDEYRFTTDRPSSLGIEVRKDLVFEFDDAGRPLRPKPEAAEAIGEAIARGITMYLTRDRPSESNRLAWTDSALPLPTPTRATGTST
jgi:hypothetical protein